MSGVMRSVATLPDAWCYEVSGFPARCLVLWPVTTLPDAGAMSVAILPDVWCYEISGYLVRCLVL